MTDKLLPCPWCKKEPVVATKLNCNKPYIVECKNCMACGPRRLTTIEAIEAWNTRPRSPISLFWDREKLAELIFELWRSKIIYCSEHKIECSINGQKVADSIISLAQKEKIVEVKYEKAD